MKTDNDGFGTSVPPLIEHVIIYFSEKNIIQSEAVNFFDYYQKKKWLNRRLLKLSNWKIAAWNWILDIRQHY